MLKLKITGKKPECIFDGPNYRKIPVGTILEVIKGGTDNGCVGEIIKRESDDFQPFSYYKDSKRRGKKVGDLWGNHLTGYVFKVIQFPTK